MQYQQIGPWAQKIRENVSRVIIGKEEQIDRVLTAVIAGGHVLLEDMPGTGNTVKARSLAPEEVPLPVSRFQGELLVKRHLLPDPFLIQSVRPYQYGDQLRDIHWPASARMGALQAKTHDYTADPRLLVVINCQMSEGQWSDLMEYEQAVIERAISLAATVCVRALRGGVSAGFAANMPLDETGACALLPPERHSAREEELLAAFARLRILRARNFLSFLEDLAFLKETDVLILSAYDSEALEEKMARLRRRGNTVTLYCLGKGGEGV